MKESNHQPILNMATLGNPWGPSPLLARQREHLLNHAEQISHKTAQDLLKIKTSQWLNVPVEQIGLSHGSSEIIEVICQTMLAGQPVVMPIPTYFGLTESLHQSGSTIIGVPAGSDQNFALNKQVVEKLIRSCQQNQAHLWLCSPNNPTGSVISPRLINELVTRLPNQLVIIDEAYLEYIEPANKTSAIHLVNQHPNLIVTKTLSKAYGLPNLRMGIVIAQSEIRSFIEDHVTQSSTLEYLQASTAIEDQQHLHDFANWLSEELASFKETLSVFSQIEASSLSMTGVMLLRHKTESLHQLLTELNVESRDMNSELGIEGEQFVRIGLQLPEVNHHFLRILSEVSEC